MKAITVEPKKPGSARWEESPDPDAHAGQILVEAVAVGVCGTDVEIAEGKYGWAPPGASRLVLGHESLGRVIDPGPASSFKKGDLVVGIVRRPDPVPCPNCAVGEWDMCRNGQYTERGIKEIHGFMSERWRIEPEYAIKVEPSLGILGVLLEPTTVITKALEQVAVIGRRSFWEPKTVLVTGAGPIGLLAALAAKMFGLDVHVLDRVETGTKPDLVRALGATYHSGPVSGIGLRTGRHHRMHRGGTGDRRFDPGDRLERDRLPDRGRTWRRGHVGSLRRHCGSRGVEEHRDRGQRQRQQAALVQGREHVGSRRPGLAAPPDHPPREAGELRAGPGATAG